MRRLVPPLLVLVFAVAPATAGADGVGGQEALTNLNAWRAELGLAPVAALDARMSEGCRLHNRYLALNKSMLGLGAHQEFAWRPGYTALGAAAGMSSVLGGERARNPRSQWEFAVYHRAGLLQPRLGTTWFSANDGYGCMGDHDAFVDDQDRVVAIDNNLRTSVLTAYPSPGNGATNVGTGFVDGEAPDPREAIPGASLKAAMGWPLSVGLNGPWEDIRSAHVSVASLTPDGGRPVAATPQDSDSHNGGYLVGSSTVGLFPHDRLESDTWYSARLAGTVTGSTDQGGEAQYPFDVVWRFRTTPYEAPAVGQLLRVRGGLRGRRLVLRIQVSSRAVGRRLLVSLRQRRSARWVRLGRRVRRHRLHSNLVRLRYRVGSRRRVKAIVTVPSFYHEARDVRYAKVTVRRTVRRR